MSKTTTNDGGGGGGYNVLTDDYYSYCFCRTRVIIYDECNFKFHHEIDTLFISIFLVYFF